MSELQPKQAPLVVITGPTASGKSSLALRLAEENNGEIICSDSRTIYRGMDIGTAKPSADERARVPHWGLDLVEPGERFTAADFKAYALQAIADIRSRGRVPFMVGGTGLYVDAVLFDYQFKKVDPALRAELEKWSLEQLHNYCANNNIKLPENAKNRRYVIRAIETGADTSTTVKAPISNTIVVGIATERDELRTRINSRSEHMFEQGMVEEAIMLGKKYGWNSEAMTGNIYKLAQEYEAGELSYDEMKQKFTAADWQLAKRQLTFMKRNPYITWLPLDKAYLYINDQLNKFKD